MTKTVSALAGASDREGPIQVVAHHARMVRDVFLNVELMLNHGIRELSEYDVQGLMFLAFRASLANTGARADREKTGKVDCVLFEDDLPKVFYEIKTYFKKSEKLQKKHFDHDLDKLRRLLRTHPDTRGFFLIAGAKGKFTDAALADFSFVKGVLKERVRRWVTYELENGASLRLRPSEVERYGRSVVVTWEVKV